MSPDTVHYLDHAATAPVRECALQAWVGATRALSAVPGNPSALHAGGRSARRLLEDARERIGAALGADRAEVVLTSGATESDALAVAGGARGARARDPRRTRVLASALEHDAVGAQSAVLAPAGFEWALLPVSALGVSVVDPAALAEAAPRLAVASLSMVSSELGTLQPVAALTEALAGDDGSRPLVHTDAAQAVGVLDVDFHALGVDLMTVGGHKIGAPAGTGVLLVRRGTPLVTDRPGGGQERGIRSGTPDVAGACALAAALEEAVAQREALRRHLTGLRARLLSGLPAGSRATLAPEAPCSPAIAHLSVDTAHPEAVLLAMDAAGVLVSAGSACHAGVTRPSAAVLALGRGERQALGVLRVSMGPTTSASDVDALLAALPQAIRAGQRLDARDRANRPRRPDPRAGASTAPATVGEARP
ncbi:MAG: aminotransferase class V-fold PLP-dependent enzyme [Actinomyces sp.]|nr:aminotransferase class V-fold PLP-dependent enzyme [Actinomyces sp.]MCI1640997.1 aminotransferase class V-fold PLP-dependent enzyme [Actinomyces sp.]MCI1690373.1 aminotransferase class V-fold PLP-dependent enzyme [Actinomyces sp.]MCI1787014.1 aminotransferase class V-fold PLP-dependent enzyme [Actinomyces sp.]MCI1829420.1 aminotransferase class V-fold PLP-dependent enzyme [Actinomyces sp.]MCI1866595.1 aminotransferase class V-fold PLP-dependent enzyme [Actinomyces sp.]